MADIETEESTWAAVPQLETTTAALGGPGGPMNAQALAITKRTNWLRDKLEKFLQAGAGAVMRKIEDLLRETVRVTDFMTEDERADSQLEVPQLNHSASVQKAFDYAATKDAKIVFPRGAYVLSNVRVTNKAVSGRPWHIFGHGARIINPATASSTTASLWFSALTAAGGTARGFDYSGGIFLHGLTFFGANNFGIGFKHAVAGQFRDYACHYINLEEGIRSLGCAGFMKNSGRTLNCVNAIHFALLADDPVTANYVAEGPGWNDNVSLSGISFGGGTAGQRAIWYRGSTSEGIVAVRDCVFTSVTEAFIEATTYQSFLIENCWTEYVNSPTCDLFRFTRNASAFEPVGAVTFRNCQFYTSNAMSFRYLIFCEGRRLKVEDCYMQIGASATYVGGIWFNSGTSNAWGSAATLTPAGTGSFTSGGLITLQEADLVNHGGSYANLYATIDGANYFLRFRSRQSNGSGGFTVTYDVKRYYPVYPAQLPQLGDNWLNSTDTMNRCGADHVWIDMNTNVTGVAFTGPTISAYPASWGLLTNNGGICEIDNVLVSGMPLNKVYQQREFGRVRIRNLRKQ